MTEDFETSTPSYLLAADIHTSLNGGSREKGFLESSIDLVAKGIPATLIAAGNEISNIPATIGNMFAGKDTYEITSTKTRMADIDSDLAQYYEDHQLGIDTAGFIIGSLVPGMAGTKVLRAGQTMLKGAVGAGAFGDLTGSALGLVAPNRQKYLAAAIEQIGTTGNAFSLTESNLLRAFAAGAGQQALEGAAWTIAVNATMNQSPILDQRDVSDMVWDVAIGAGLGAAVGGLVEGIGAAWKVKKAFTAAEAEIVQWTEKGLEGAPAASLSTSDKILWKLRQLDSIPDIPPDHPFAQRAGRVAADTQRKLKGEVRSLLGELTADDQPLASLVQRNIDSNDFMRNLSNYFSVEQITRVPAVTKLDKEIAKIGRNFSKNLDLNAEFPYRTTYLNLRTMEVSAEAPKMLNLADTAVPSLTPQGIKVGDILYKQTNQADLLQMGHLQAEARYVWAEQVKAFDPTKTHVIGGNDIPLLQKAIREGVTSVTSDGIAIESMEQLVNYTKTRQATIAAALKERGIPNEMVAKIVNVDESALFGGVDNPSLWNLRKHLSDTLSQKMGGNPHELPTYARMVSKVPPQIMDANGHLLEGMAIISQKEKLYQEAAARIAADVTGKIMGGEEVLFPSLKGTSHMPIGASSGASFLAAEGGNYGTLSSAYAYIGNITHRVKKAAQAATSDIFSPTLQKMAVQVDDAIEFSVLNEKLRNLPQGYSLSDDGSMLILRRVTQEMDEPAINKMLAEIAEDEAKGIPNVIEIKSPLVKELVRNHISRNDFRRSSLNLIHTNNGSPDKYVPGTFYPIPRNPKDTPHFAYVIDQSASSRGHSKMIYAKDGQTLEAMRNEIMSDPELVMRGITVLTKEESEQYFKSIGQYEFERTLSDNYINTILARKGKSASFLPLTDPQRIVTDFLDWHLARDANLVRSTVEHRYAQEFATLRNYASPAIQSAKSKFGYVSPLAFAENTVDNPAANLMKMALDISKVDEYPLWTPLNRFLDSGFSSLTEKIGKTFSKATSPEHLEEINAALKKAGYSGAEEVTASLYEAMNGKVARGALTSIVNKMNSILATFALRSDPFNALNNAVGSSVLLGAEMKSLFKAIESGNAEAAGELAKLSKIKVPGTSSFTLSPAKMVAKRIGDFHSDKAGREWFRKHGFITSITEQYDQTLDHISIAIANGDHTALQKAMVAAKGLGDKAEVWTANKLAEEFNRYVAAGVAKDVTDIAVKHGILDEATALTYINTFVNRTQGNYLASQRPILFQGPIGQAMGLFQTYQFNLLQQVFRHIGEGDKKTLATLAGLQMGIYGMNGLPAFNAINTYIIGNAPGNPQSKNLYDAVMSGAGKEAGEWLLYGGLSNGLSVFHPDLKTNIYSRGDINPRHITLVPTDPSKVPVYQATERFLKNTYEGLQQVAMGADVWGTFLHGIEQNGISRPLAGLAQVLEGVGREDGKVVSRNQQGNILMSHDLYSLTSMMRVLGAKPLDEAMVNDAMFRINVYRANDAEKRKVLAEGIKTSILSGAAPSESQILDFASAYAKAGGKQDEFASFMASQYRNASASQANQLRQKLSSPHVTHLQYIMGGYRLEDLASSQF